MRLAWTYWGIPSSFFEIGVQYGLRACGPQSILNPNFSEFRWYSQIRPRQTHSIPSVLYFEDSSEHRFKRILMPGLHALVSFFKETPASYFIYSCWKLLHLASIDLHATHAIEKCNTFSKHILLYKFQDMFRITLWFECQYIQLLANAYTNFSWHSKRCDKMC